MIYRDQTPRKSQKSDPVGEVGLAKLHASGFLPEVWMLDEETETRRRVVAERRQLVSQTTRLKNRIQSVLHANLIPPYKGVLFSKRGRAWLEAQPLSEDQRRVVLRHAGELDRLGSELAEVDIRRPPAISVPYCRRSGEVRPFQSARGCKQAIHTLAGSASYDGASTAPLERDHRFCCNPLLGCGRRPNSRQ